ncbi:CHC2 zinc finger domain-containing protein [Mycoplasmopsis felis]|uniref:CHC2 zinc finger domain-containing protein n=1 Tax=Mycoplasmopsis felis TaxID=33923 RepID=UPI0021B07E57|nr:CHC2 zinc finger domain-containing protein [Mycoplasmopsis felis]MCU9931415.1 CHC2 zinc finger domain-containing protein [Mycoplasmopsis felis]UWW00958.1 CHC2 zinc finger domain-containing protein [Mycoplasmopsis felis]
MNKSIPTELYNSIISQVNIVDIISNFVSLSKKGNNYVGLCPFHQDSSPSFMVNPTKNIYKCFPCGKGGDAIKFLRDKENMSFIQSLEYIANQLGMDVNFEEFKNNSNFTSKYNETELELLEILKAANAFYKTQLIKNQDAINYLKHRQIYQSDIIDKFDIGFAPDNNSLSNYLITKLNYSPEQLLKVGLINDSGMSCLEIELCLE